MRANLLAWSFGLVSVSLLAGCALFEKNTCDKCGGTTHTVRNRLVGASPKKATTAVARTKSAKPSQAEGDLKLTGHAKGNGEIEVGDDPTVKQAKSSGAAPYKVEYLPTAAEVVSQKVISETPPPPKTADGEQNVVLKNVAFKYGRGANFESVTGQVQIFRKTVRLRYASIEQEDAYGGVVILEGSEIGNLRDGQHVRVQGTFVAPADRNGNAKYRVHTVEMLD